MTVTRVSAVRRSRCSRHATVPLEIPVSTATTTETAIGIEALGVSSVAQDLSHHLGKTIVHQKTTIKKNRNQTITIEINSKLKALKKKTRLKTLFQRRDNNHILKKKIKKLEKKSKKNNVTENTKTQGKINQYLNDENKRSEQA